MNTNMKLSLDTRRKKKDNSYPIILRLSHLRKTTSISLGHSIQKDFWDEKNQKVKRTYNGVSNVSKLNNQLIKEKARATDIINDLFEKDELNFLSITQLKNRIVKTSNFDSFLDYTNSQIKDLRKAQRYGTANSYFSVSIVLKKFNNGNDIKFNEINYEFLKKFEEYHYSRGNSTNGLASYMKTIRAIYNKAIKAGIINKEAYPFTHYQIKLVQTEKRAIEKENIKAILNLKLDINENLFHYRNYFLASYMLYGISFIDLAFLKLENIIDNRIIFQRKKTSKPYNIKITEPLREILSYYLKDKEPSDFIFPIISRDIYELQYKDVLWARKRYNKGLKEIAKLCGIEQRLTSYVSRHSFATHAMFQNIPLQAISAMLGHTKLTTTQIYLKSLPSNVLDKYNEELLNI